MEEQRQRVLIVEEDRVEAGILAFHLRRAGLITLLVASEEEALDAVAWGTPYAIVAELRGKGANGLRLVRRLAGVPVVVIVIAAEALTIREELEALEFGVAEIFPKPIDPALVADRIRRTNPRPLGIRGEGRAADGIRGELDVRPLPELLQLCHRLALSARLEVETEGRPTALLIRDGRVIDAENGVHYGQLALDCALKTGDQGGFALFPLPPDAPELRREARVAQTTPGFETTRPPMAAPAAVDPGPRAHERRTPAKSPRPLPPGFTPGPSAAAAAAAAPSEAPAEPRYPFAGRAGRSAQPGVPVRTRRVHSQVGIPAVRANRVEELRLPPLPETEARSTGTFRGRGEVTPHAWWRPELDEVREGVAAVEVPTPPTDSITPVPPPPRAEAPRRRSRQVRPTIPPPPREMQAARRDPGPRDPGSITDRGSPIPAAVRAAAPPPPTPHRGRPRRPPAPVTDPITARPEVPKRPSPLRERVARRRRTATIEDKPPPAVRQALVRHEDIQPADTLASRDGEPRVTSPLGAEEPARLDVDAAPPAPAVPAQTARPALERERPKRSPTQPGTPRSSMGPPHTPLPAGTVPVEPAAAFARRRPGSAAADTRTPPFAGHDVLPELVEVAAEDADLQGPVVATIRHAGAHASRTAEVPSAAVVTHPEPRLVEPDAPAEDLEPTAMLQAVPEEEPEPGPEGQTSERETRPDMFAVEPPMEPFLPPPAAAAEPPPIQPLAPPPVAVDPEASTHVRRAFDEPPVVAERRGVRDEPGRRRVRSKLDTYGALEAAAAKKAGVPGWGVAAMVVILLGLGAIVIANLGEGPQKTLPHAGLVGADGGATPLGQPERVQLAFGKALLALDDNKMGSAKIHLLEVISADPNHEGALAELGLLYFQQNEFAEAAKHFQVLTKLRPKDADPLFYVGAAKLYLREFDGARQALDRMLQLDPRHARAADAREWLDRLPTDPE